MHPLSVNRFSLPRFPRTLPTVILNWLELTYLAGFFIVAPITMVFPYLIQGEGDEWAFMPLMLTSVYCAVGLVWAYIRLGYLYLIG
jgi:alpha-1,3-glucosyltransferase